MMTLNRRSIQKTIGVMALSVVSSGMVVPDRMQLTPTMKSKDWSKTSLIPIEFSVGVQEMTTQKSTASQVIADNMDETTPPPFDGFEIFGIIKETGVDDEGLEEFYKEYFSYPLYRDEGLEFYDAFGNGSILKHVSFNPWKIWKGIREMGQRMKTKQIEGNMVGEGLTTGGIIIFGTDGKPKYMYPEITGSAIDEDDLLSAIEDVRNLEMSPADTTEL